MSVPHPNHSMGDSPHKKVNELVRKYQRSSYPSPVMLEVLNDPDSYSILVGSLRRQLSLVKCRSQDFENCQITVYDRALLILSNYGDGPADPGALELYLTEFLGVVPIAPSVDGKETVSKLVELQTVLDQAVRSAKEEREIPVSTKGYEREQEQPSTFDIHDEYDRYYPDKHESGAGGDKVTRELGRTARELDDPVIHILEVYRQAKEDYINTKERDGLDSLSAVRFLRDTAENALRYLHTNGMSSHSWIPDLEQTFAIARDKTAQLLGGRKRHFDVDNRSRSRRRDRKRSRRAIDSYRPNKDGL